MSVRRSPLTRRQALGLGAAAASALGGLRPGRAAARAAAPFELELERAGARPAGAGWRRTAVLSAPRRFDLVGLRWARGGRLDAQVRARPRGGAWTAWVDLPAAADHGPDGAGARAGTDPAWTGAANELQLRLRGSARGLRARFVHARPVVARRRGRRALFAAHRQVGVPAIIPRAAWGGDSVAPRAAASYGQVQLAFVHHTATANDYGPEDSAAIVLGIARYHRDSNGWNDVGYNFLVDRYGQIFEGRAGGIDAPIVGAQAQGFNSVSTGIACLGSFISVAQTEAGIDALARLISWKLSLHGVPVQGQVTVTSAGGPSNRFGAGVPVTFERISGHRDGNQTTCPGNLLYAQLADLRARAARYATSPSAMTLTASSTRLRGVTRAIVSGTLRFADGSSPGGVPVEVVFAAAGTAFLPLASAVTNADGSWATPITLPRTGTVRARFPGDAVRPPLESADVGIQIISRLTIALSTNRMRRGSRVRVSGLVTPAPDGVADVLLERQDRRGRWRRVGTRRIRVQGGRYAVRRRIRVPGLYRLTVKAGGASIRRRIRVTRR